MERNPPLGHVLHSRPTVRDNRYSHVFSIWRAGDLTSLNRMFEIIPKSVVAEDLGMHYHSFTNKLKRPELLNIKHLVQLHGLTGISISALVELVVADIREKAAYTSKK